MARTPDVVFTYDYGVITDLEELAPGLGISYTVGELTRDGKTAYILMGLSDDEYLIASEAVELSYGSLYYSSENQLPW